MAGQGKKTSAERRRELAAERKAAAAEARRKARMRAIAVTVAVVLAGGAVVGAVFGVMAIFDGDDTEVAAEASPTPSPTPLPAPAGKANCTYTADGSPASKDVGTPPSLANATGTYEATIQVNKKPVVMELDAAAAPCAVNNFVYLAKAKYFDNTQCHRELNSTGTFVLQCGDPDATGRGGPGYSFADENLEGATYEAGVVAMANAGPNTNGSQFFMMFKDSEFGPDYVPFGKIISGLDVLTDIAKAGTKTNPDTGADDAPKNKVTINKVTITKEPKASTPSAEPSATSKATKTAKPKASSTPEPSTEPSATSTP
ncbi:peptidylprolyl isomerase [Sporichthya sp.]|uniref:peptidylprolyl isomerase n=1 Tax=Sporichthya sp. TaxID=65475 RepID=UPI00181856B9|nr:peptidylprolyl isomerase [Sporichthya sp.]MBA3742946.1 peptidylprolyl isomerase [Sporichthya sp.]